MAQLAATGAIFTEVDRSAARMRRVGENFARRGFEAETVIADAAVWRPAQPADAVPLDAPCTATGTIRRHPDVAHLKSAADVGRLSALQDRLLHAAVDMTAPGGLLVYACCSLQPQEGAARIKDIIGDGAPVEGLPVRHVQLVHLNI